MTSRLDRLFLLLDTGSSPVTRKAAALQLGEVQKLHPHELHNLLGKVRQYLHSSSWDTRIAAGQAIEAIISNVPHWNPSGSPLKEEAIDDVHKTSAGAGRMKFSQFDINKVIQNGSDLLASEGKEYEVDEIIGMDPKEKLAKQRQLLNKRLGLDMVECIGLDTTDIFSNDDLEWKCSPDEWESKENKRALSEVFQSEIAGIRPCEINKSNKKAKCSDNQNSSEAFVCGNRQENEPPGKKSRLSNTASFEQGTCENFPLQDDITDDVTLWEEPKEWPFGSLCDELAHDLFNPSWEIRHGAATALREIVRIHGKGANRCTNTPQVQMDLLNQLWLEDMSLRLLCVLALDKFGDFISDQVVAPVRETCAQALGAVLSLMWQSGVEGVLHVLLQLLERPEWEARHGGLLGLKYVLAVRHDMTCHLVPIVFEPVCRSLQDSVDDVSAVAAAALVPVTDVLVKKLPHEVPRVISSLWDALLELDDLTASTSSILMLLASLLSYPYSVRSKCLAHSLNNLVPRLWPFLSHSSSGVRKSVLETLVTLTSESNPQLSEIWLPSLLPNALRLIYQRCLIEHRMDIHELLYKVWYQLVTNAPLPALLSAACPYLSPWLCMLMQPVKVPLDPNVNSAWLEIKHKPKDKSQIRGRKFSSSETTHKDGQEQYYIAGSEALCDTPIEREKCVARARCMAARFLGLLSSYITRPISGFVASSEVDSPLDCFAKLLLFHLNSKSALQRVSIGLVITSWAGFEKGNSCPQSVKEKCLECLNENIYFDEIAVAFTRMQQECKDFVALLRHHKVNLEPPYQLGCVLTVEQALSLATSAYHSAVSTLRLKSKVMEDLDEKQKSLMRTVMQTSHDQLALSTLVHATLAGTLVALEYLPHKLNPLIRPLMNSVKREENELFQSSSASSLVNLMELCQKRNNSPNFKIIKNLTTFLCSDPLFTPLIATEPCDINLSSDCLENVEDSCIRPETPVLCIEELGILSLVNMQKSAERIAIRRCSSLSGRRITSASTEVPLDECTISEDECQKLNELQRRGATFVVTEAAKKFGAELPCVLEGLWDAMFRPLKQIINPIEFDVSLCSGKGAAAQELVHSLQIIEIVGPSLHSDLQYQLVSVLPHLCCCLEHPYTAVRHMASRCLGMLSKIATAETMDIVLDNILGKLGATDNDIQRQGSVEAISYIIDSLGLDIIEYIAFLIIPVLGRMSDQNEHVRLMATHCFASLIRLIPLEEGVKGSINLRPDLIERKIQERGFLEQLMNPKKLDSFKLPIPVNADLRSYQQEGVNWLAFLNKYQLHGILCDDMGLGKTLQSICILASDHYVRQEKFNNSHSPDKKPLPSLVVCPPTLTGHWMYEVEKFTDSKYLNPLHYTGPPAERMRLRGKAKRHNLIVASYDIVRNDIEYFSSIHWNYAILDEGHIIKNGKTKLARAVKQLSANHRLILTGTPIQNNVLELWSLFDFLIPGFLGSEKQFTARYSKPILQSRDAKSCSKEQEAGVLAMESLHRQVLPFLLRRMKDDVLKDLPPKIIQDYYCELSPLQVQLYEDFAKSRARQNLEETFIDDKASQQGSSHIFQALQYLRKVCNHPKLVLTSQHPEYERISQQLKEQNSNLADIQHAAKLNALRQLLQDCGIGLPFNSTHSGPQPVVSQHRALVFCQLKSMLDILEKDLFKTHMPSVSYLRLDGTIPPGMRHAVVHRFNNDPSMDILLLTTQVGGLGLNLTGADTVIFVEHDWNPMKDLQAMDRAHRIGQKKVVNVYRLITRGTLEEKIMGLQKFKLTIANTVISQENSSLQTMGTDQLLDLFKLDDRRTEKESNTANLSKSNGKGIKAVLESLPELWDTEQYESEYDLNSFLQSLHK